MQPAFCLIEIKTENVVSGKWFLASTGTAEFIPRHSLQTQIYATFAEELE